ncbi:hypothetical protein CAEBREN_18507 [Caenorhabditis brenneri]|uniref:3'-5' exonuclease domain-containing protein n=1 Tax=Caenorhabditis brenneri TaxID=135651 RepID=G0NVL7_CAEBE|nr:hypothetical protein CAEBREN_18507 [Caenorhabditis brenneri]
MSPPHEYVDQQIRKFVKKFLNDEKDFDLTTASDLVKYGSSKGPYPRFRAQRIWGSLGRFFERVHPSAEFRDAIHVNLFSARIDRREITELLGDVASHIPPKLNYPHFRNGRIRIITCNEKELEWIDILSDFRKPSSHPIYFDTEGLYSKRRFGCDIAALTFYDVDQKKVLIIRINRFNCQDYRQVQAEIRGLAITRTFAVFGLEPFLHNLVDIKKIYNCQRMFGECQRSLKDMCAEIGLMVYKGQTMSNWGRNHLRHDQKQYAAMDAVALRYLHKDQIKRGDLLNGNYSDLLEEEEDDEGEWP